MSSGPEVLLDEAPQEGARLQRAVGGHLIERNDVETTLGPVVAQNVRRNEPTLGSHNRDVDGGERGDGTGLAVLENLEVVFAQAGHLVTCPVGDDDTQLDGVN